MYFIYIQEKVKDCKIGCGLCTCKFSRSTSLYRHLRAHALKKDLMPHLCSFCQVGFLDTYSLYLHASIEHHAASVTVNEPTKVIQILLITLFMLFYINYAMYTIVISVIIFYYRNVMMRKIIHQT